MSPNLLQYIAQAIIVTLCLGRPRIILFIISTAMPVRNGTPTKYSLLKWGFFDWRKNTLKGLSRTFLNWIESSGLPNLALCIFVVQMSKLEVWIQFCCSAWSAPCTGSPRLSPGFFFITPTLTSGSFAAPWATRIYNTSFESPEKGPILFSLK